MKRDKHFEREKRIIWLKKRREELNETASSFAIRYNNTNWIELPKPIHHGYWCDYIPHSRYFGTEREQVINEVLDACWHSKWSRNKDFKRVRRHLFYNEWIADIIFNNLSKEKYDSLSPQAKTFFYKETGILKWNGQEVIYYVPLENNIIQQCEWKITKSYTTHIAIPPSDDIRKLDEVNKELYDITNNHPWREEKGRWELIELYKTKRKSRREIRDKIKVAIAAQDWDVLDQNELRIIWYSV